jgi:DNA-binding HxlR family transcriptional regulator
MDQRCPICNVADFIGKRWTIVIMAELFRGREQWKRYSAIKKGVHGITPKMLAMRLREMQKEGIIERRVSTDTAPVKSEYRLTPKGRDFMSVVTHMKGWALKWKVGNSHCDNASCLECEI